MKNQVSKLTILLLLLVVFNFNNAFAQVCDPSAIQTCAVPNANGFIEDAHIASYHSQVISTTTGFTSTGRSQGPAGANLISFTAIESPLFPIPAGVRLLKSATGGLFETQTAYLGDDSIIYLVGGVGNDAMTTATGTTGNSFGPAAFGLPTGVTVCDVDKLKGALRLFALSTTSGDLYLMGQSATSVFSGANDTVFTQIPMPAGVTVDSFALGLNLLFIMGSDGNFYTMGTASYLGDGSAPVNRLAMPTLMTAPPLSAGGAVQILTGGGHYMVLDADGTIHVLGENAQGQLGNNSVTDSTTWDKVGTTCTDGVLQGVEFIATVNSNDFNLRYTSSAILADGSIINWGLGNNFSLSSTANGLTTCPTRPCFQDISGTMLPDPQTHITISAGGHITPSITSDGMLCNVGHNADGAYGDGTAGDRQCYTCIDSPPVRESCVVIAGLAPKPELSKSVVGVTANTDGTYNVDYELLLETTVGDYCNVSLEDDLATQFGCGFDSIASAPVLTINNASATTTITTASADGTYNGTSGSSMIVPNPSECLAPGDTVTVNFSVKVNPVCSGIPSPLENSAVVSGQNTGGTLIGISDISDDMSDLDGDGAIDGENGTSEDPTSVELPLVTIGDKLFFDNDQDGIQDPSEFSLAGVTVNLYDSNGNLLQSVISAADGSYSFSVVPGVDFVIRLDNPADFAPGGLLADLVLTDANIGSEDVDSDGQLVDGFPTINVQSPSSGEDLTFGFGFVGENTSAHNAALDSLTLVISNLTSQLSRRISRNCASEARILKRLANRSADIYTQIWHDVWGALKFSQSSACKEVSNVETKKSIRKRLRNLRRVKNKMTQLPCDLTQKNNKLAKRIQKMINKAKKMTNEVPDVGRDCSESSSS